MDIATGTVGDYRSLYPPGRDPLRMREQVRRQWHGLRGDDGGFWVFGYASLIWRPEIEFVERRTTRVHGWHRTLAMWSRVNRGTPERPGLVFALLPGGSCQGFAYHVPRHCADAMFDILWAREMPDAVYDPRWLRCPTDRGVVRGLAFTLSRRSPSYAGPLSPERYREIFRSARGRYGTTLDYARQTLESLRAHGVHDRQLAGILGYADELA